MQRDDLREKTVQGLACCDGAAVQLGHCPEDCPYLAESERADKCVEKLHADALVLLKGQEARIMTLEELSADLEGQFLWVEAYDGVMYHMEVLAVHLSASGVTDIDFNLPTCYLELPTKTIGKKWRPWTALPTKEQTEAVEWE